MLLHYIKRTWYNGPSWVTCYIWYSKNGYAYSLSQLHNLTDSAFLWHRVYSSVFLPLPRTICNRHWTSICLSATLQKNFQTDLHEIFRECWQWANEQMIKFWWRSGSPSGYRDCFPELSLLGDTESVCSHSFTMIHQMAEVVIIKLEDTERFARWWDWYHDTGKMCLGGGMHCLSASSLLKWFLKTFSLLLYLVSDIAVFVLKRDVKLQLINYYCINVTCFHTTTFSMS